MYARIIVKRAHQLDRLLFDKPVTEATFSHVGAQAMLTATQRQYVLR